MTDQCKRCPHRGDIKSCEAIDCSYHDSWYAKEQQKQIKQLEQELKTANESLDIAYQAGAADMKQERDALKAHCEGYHHLCNILYMSVHVSEIKSLSVPVRDLWLAGQADFAAKERGDLPDYRLNEIKAQAIKDAIGEATIMWADGLLGDVVLVDELYEYAQQIRESAK